MASDSSSPNSSLEAGLDGRLRCWWACGSSDYEDYHDHEWGRRCRNDHERFERLTLESFQSGLSWLTILRKRDEFRHHFENFDYRKIATFDESDVTRLVQEPGIIRHRGKIEAAINNARRACEMEDEFSSLVTFFDQYIPPKSERPATMDRATLATMNQTPTSRRLAADLKKRGWKFIGPTTAYSFMQACGLVDDHVTGCEFG